MECKFCNINQGNPLGLGLGDEVIDDKGMTSERSGTLIYIGPRLVAAKIKLADGTESWTRMGDLSRKEVVNAR